MKTSRDSVEITDIKPIVPMAAIPFRTSRGRGSNEVLACEGNESLPVVDLAVRRLATSGRKGIIEAEVELAAGGSSTIEVELKSQIQT